MMGRDTVIVDREHGAKNFCVNVRSNAMDVGQKRRVSVSDDFRARNRDASQGYAEINSAKGYVVHPPAHQRGVSRS
jgi:hypothetical protein